jgi:hypothetical protein
MSMRSVVPDVGAPWLERAAKIRERQRHCRHQNAEAHMDHVGDGHTGEELVVQCADCGREIDRIRAPYQEWSLFT